VFSVPLEFCGETAQCAECDAIFEIPNPDEAGSDENMTGTDTGPIKGAEADPGEATNTVRLSRTGIGMIPQVKDSFAFGGAPAAPAAPKPSPAKPAAPSRPAAPAPAPAAPAPSPASAAASDFAPPPPQPAPEKKKEKIVIPSWTKIRMKKDEEVLGLKEYTASPAAVAVTGAAIAAACGAAGIALAKNLPIAAVAVLVLAVAAFAAIFFMGKGGSKSALVLTSLRAICVIGSKRLEITK
jgi:hypothetical protein